MGDGIAFDVFQYLLTLLHGGRGYARVVTTFGDNVTHPLAQDAEGIWPALNIVNQGNAPIRWGFEGQPTVLLPGGASTTIRYKNPKTYGLCYTDLGVSGIEIDVYS